MILVLTIIISTQPWKTKFAIRTAPHDLRLLLLTHTYDAWLGGLTLGVQIKTPRNLRYLLEWEEAEMGTFVITNTAANCSAMIVPLILLSLLSNTERYGEDRFST